MKQVTIYSSECTSCGSIQNHIAKLRGTIGEANYEIIDTNISHYFDSDKEAIKPLIAEHIAIMEKLDMNMDKLRAVVDTQEEDGTHTYADLRSY